MQVSYLGRPKVQAHHEENMDDDLREECGRKSAFVKSVMANLCDSSIERITYCQPNVSTYAVLRPVQLVMTDDTPPLDPDVKIQIEKAWDEWTNTFTHEVGETDPLEEINLMIEKARAEKLDRMQRGHEVTLMYQMGLLAEREAQEAVLREMFAAVKPDAIELMAAVAEELPKPVTPRERLHAMKAHPRSARGRR